MIAKENLMLCSVRQLAEYLSAILDPHNVANQLFPDCDFAIVDEEYGDEVDLHYIKSGANGWYGIKAIDTGFDSDQLDLFCDYYGGGAGQYASFWDDMEDASSVSIADGIEGIILGTLTVSESASSETMLIVDFL